MKILNGFMNFIGYDKDGTITELPTTLSKKRLGTKSVWFSGMGFNAPGWIAASMLPTVFFFAGKNAPLAILIAFLFPLLIIALAQVYLVRQAPSANAAFTFVERFIHRDVGTVIGWAYVFETMIVVGMTGVIGAYYIQALFPAMQSVLIAKIIGTVMILTFLMVLLRGVEFITKFAEIFLVLEISVVVILGLLGLFMPKVEGVSISSLYIPDKSIGWIGIGQGVLYGFWMMCNFDSGINLIEEAKKPVRTVQRSLLLSLVTIFVIYTIAAIGWQKVIPAEMLGNIMESGDGGPIGAVANEYVPSLSWIAILAVITSSIAGMQLSMLSGSRAAYRMSMEGRMPKILSKVNKHKAPWVVSTIMASLSITFIWMKPQADLAWYYDAITASMVLAYGSILLAFVFAMFKQKKIRTALLASVIPSFAIIFLLYLLYTAGLMPVDPKDLYQAWYFTAFIVIFGIVLIIYHRVNLRKSKNELLENAHRESS